MLDPVATFHDRWFFIIPVVVILILYLFSTGFRKFLATVAFPMLLQMMWEGISIPFPFPYTGLKYITPDTMDVYMTIIPLGSLVMKTVLFLSSSYLLASMLAARYKHSKLDSMLDETPRKYTGNIMAAFFASILSTVLVIIVEPIIANISIFGVAPYEHFVKSPWYFGVSSLYFIGWFVSSFATFLLVALAEGFIEIDRKRVYFDFENAFYKKNFHQGLSAIVFMFTASIAMLASLYVSVSLFLFNVFLFFPLLVLLLFAFVTWAEKIEKERVESYCDDHPDSLYCIE